MIYQIESISDKKFSQNLYEKAYQAMSKERQQKADRLLKEEDKRLCVFADCLLREMLESKGITNPEFYTDEKGKPYIKGNPLYFSISHSGSFVACAIDSRPVGIDIEAYRNIPDTLAKRFCTEEELLFIFEKSDKINVKKFFSVWTAKEAYLKCTGEGLSGGLKSIVVSTKDNIKDILTSNHRLFCTATDYYALSVVTSI